MTNQCNPKKSFLKVNKFWQCDNLTVVWQINIRTDTENEKMGKNKFYLLLDSNQSSFGIRIIENKPEAISSGGNLSALVRKHLGSQPITEIVKDESNGDFFISFGFNEDEKWLVKLQRSKPPEISLISPRAESLIRSGAKGIFTKKTTYEGRLPDRESGQFSDMLENIISEFSNRILSSTKEGKLVESDDSSHEPLSGEQREIIKRLKRRLKTISKAKEKQFKSTPSESLIQEFESKAILLKVHSYEIVPKTSIFSVPDPNDRKETVIELNPLLTPGENIDKYFQKLKKLKKGRSLGLQQIEKMEKECQSIETDLKELKEKSLDSAELAIIRNRHNLSTHIVKNEGGKSRTVAKPFIHYKTGDNFSILVGKSAEENDILVKNAKSNDYWFHSVSAKGSHIIVPVMKGITENIPNELLRTALVLAIHFSKQKESQSGEVYFGRRSNLKKKKAAPDGLWDVDRAEIIYVKYSEDELKGIFEKLTLA
ncbi:MAG: DUF814 domain-containing protein [Oligoflexales bacterium]|nr:DUF814 domain-containing protein [Oligoflexales bacterium]